MPDAHDLKRCLCGICQGTEHVECRVHPKLAAHMSDAGCCSMKKWRKDETDFMLVETALDGRGWSGCVDAQRLEDISAAATRRCRPRAMFRYGQTGARNHKSSSC